MTQATTDFRTVLQAQFSARRRRNPSYSLRAFARDLAISPSRLSEVLSGRFALSAKTARGLACAMGLTAAEAQTFCDLVDLEFDRQKLAKVEIVEPLGSPIGRITVAGVDCPAKPGVMRFDHDGNVTQAMIRHCRIRAGGNQLDVAGPVYFSPLSAPFPAGAVLLGGYQTVTIGGQRVELNAADANAPDYDGHADVSFFPSGAIRSGTVFEPVTLPFADGQSRLVLGDTWALFDEEGRVVDTRPWSRLHN